MNRMLTGMMTKTLTIDKGQKPTPEQLNEIEEAMKYPIEFDPDCEELSQAMVKALQCATKQSNRRKNA